MARSKNILVVKNISESLKKAKALILSDYRGLNVSQMSTLRLAVKKAGGNFEVTKNTLLRLAAKNGKWRMENGELVGPTAALWIFENDPAPIKALVDFIRQNERPKIKTGFWGGEPISEERIFQLASLPGAKELQAQLVSRLQSPILGLVFSLNWNLQKLAMILKGVKN